MSRVALLGIGLMGAPMGERLLDQGLDLTVWNRTAEKAATLVARGAHLAASPRAALAAADVTVLMLRDGPVIRALLLAGDGLPDLTGKTVLQMSTIAPAESRELAAAVEAAGGGYLEAPVLGSTPQARDGKMIVFAGGSPAVFERALEVLRHLGPEPVLVGGVGSAAAVKLALNQIIASHITTFSLALGLVRGSGVDPEAFLAILRKSALHAPAFDGKLPRILGGDFGNPNFPTEMLRKDVDLALAEAGHLGLDATALAGIRQVIDKAVAAGFGRDDYAAIAAVIAPPKAVS
jgi:3-hydroxyisobutyrate dehydrogenase